MDHPCYSLEEHFSKGQTILSFNIEDIHYKAPYDESSIHRHNFYEIYLFETGGGSHTIEFDIFEIKDQSISVVFPRQFHQLDITKDTKGTVIMFSEELFCSDILRKELRAYCIDLQVKLNNLQLDDTQFKEITDQSNMIQELFKDLNIIKNEQIRHIIKITLLKLMDISKFDVLSQRDASDANTFLEFSNMVDNQFHDVRLVSEYSEQMGLSTKKLNALTKKISGQTALQVIHERILQESKHLLAFTSMSHKEIAYKLKFDSPSAFNKFIHAKTDTSPSELQSKLTQIYNKGA